MLKKTITYTDFDGNSVTEDHYFHLSKADLVEMQMSVEGGLQAYLERVVQSQDGKLIIEAFKELIRRSYGQRQSGRFIKDSQITAEFMSSEAYSEFFMSLVTDAGAASEFVNGIVPAGLDQEAAKLQAATAESNVQEIERPADPTGLTNPITPRVLTRAEVLEMDSDELKSGLATGRYKLS